MGRPLPGREPPRFGEGLGVPWVVDLLLANVDASFFGRQVMAAHMWPYAARIYVIATVPQRILRTMKNKKGQPKLTLCFVW